MNNCIRPPKLYLPKKRSLLTPTDPAQPGGSSEGSAPAGSFGPLINFRPYQRAAFDNRSNGIEVWLWGRQTGKSFTLAAWAVDRLVTMPGHTVTVFSNSKFNGMEFNKRCAEVCTLVKQSFEQVDLSTDDRFENLRHETRIHIRGKTSRILILAPKPLTARSFTGDLILDEFAYQERSGDIWAAVEPIVASNPQLLCRIASTPNGKHNEFYRRVTDPNAVVRRVTRTDAFAQGCLIYHPLTRKVITPPEARALAQNKRDYDQNYECSFEDESMALLTYDLIATAERENVGYVCAQNWSPADLAYFEHPTNPGNIQLDKNAASKNQSTRAEPDSCSNRRQEVGDFSPGASEPTPLAVEVSRFLGHHHVSAPIIERKSLHDWVASVSSEDEQTRMYRHILMNVCNGSADRMEILEQTRAPIALNEKFAPYYAYNAYRELAKPKKFNRQLFAGIDVGREKDRTVVTVIERIGAVFIVRGILRIDGMSYPHQQARIEQALRIPDLIHAKIDQTGAGFPLLEYLQRNYRQKISGVNFAGSIPLSSLPAFMHPSSVHPHPTTGNIRAPEFLAIQLQALYQSKCIQHPIDSVLRDELRKPERYISPTGRVSIAATRNENGHADHFWSLALAVYAGLFPAPKPLQYTAIESKHRQRRTGI